MNTSSVYVVTNYENTDINELYSTKEEANNICTEFNDSLKLQYKKLGAYKNMSEDNFNFMMECMLYKVYSLYDAIENLKERVEEDARSEYQDESY